MDKLKIIRPNGEEEIAELTTDKSLVGNNYLKLDIGGVPHYAKVGDVIETHAYTFSGVDGKKYYVQKKIAAEALTGSIEVKGNSEFIVPERVTVIEITAGSEMKPEVKYIKVTPGSTLSIEFFHVRPWDYGWFIESESDKVYGTQLLMTDSITIRWSSEINEHETEADLTT